MNSHQIAATELPRLETALVGAALNHAGEAATLRQHVRPEEIQSKKLRAVLEAIYALEPSGLLETPEPTAEVVLDLLHRDSGNVSLQDLFEISGRAACPGNHFERVLGAWKALVQGRRRAERLEELAERARRGEDVDLSELEGVRDE
jgi:hypothetical protein